MSRSLRSRIPETVAPSTRVCVSINLSYLSIYGRKFAVNGDRLSRVALGLARVRERSGIGVSA